MENSFREALKQRGCAFGHMVMEFGTRGIARILEAAGADFAVIDMEHSGFDVDRVADLMSWFRAARVAPFVRIPQAEYHFIARCLDAGALGIMCPNVETAAQAQSLVRAAKYAPMGARGVGLGMAHTDYRMPNPEAYLAEANSNAVVICQIESPTGVENAREIAAVPGVDCLWVGHFDLSHAMGITGQFQHPSFLRALSAVMEAASVQHIVAAAQPGSDAQAAEWWKVGFRVLSWKSDIALYRAALTDGIIQLKKLSL